MTVLTLPVAPGILSIDWKLQQPSQINRSEFTGKRRVSILPTAPRWSASVKIVPMVGEAKVRPWRAFLALLQGQAGKFKLPASEGLQGSGLGTVMVDGATQTGNTLATRGWTPGTAIGAGWFVTLGEQLLQVTAAATAGSDGKATLAIMPRLWRSPADGDAIEVVAPYAVMSLSSDTAGWGVSAGQRYDITFDCEEVF